jgi:hypothetical protein
MQFGKHQLENPYGNTWQGALGDHFLITVSPVVWLRDTPTQWSALIENEGGMITHAEAKTGQEALDKLHTTMFRMSKLDISNPESSLKS